MTDLLQVEIARLCDKYSVKSIDEVLEIQSKLLAVNEVDDDGKKGTSAV